MILKLEGKILTETHMDTNAGLLRLLVSEEHGGVDSRIEIHLTREMAEDLRECLEVTLDVDAMKKAGK